MLVPTACPKCQGDLLVAQNMAVCQRCGYLTDVNTVRRMLTLQRLEATRRREELARV